MKSLGKTTWLIWGATAGFIGLALWFGLTIYRTAERDIAEQFNNQQLILAKEAAAGIQEYFTSLKRELRLLTAMPGQLAQSSPEEKRRFYEKLKDAGIVDVWEVDRDYQLAFSLYYRASRSGFTKRILRQIELIDTQEIKITGTFHLPGSKPPFGKAMAMVGRTLSANAPGQPVSYLVFIISLDNIIQRFISPVKSGQTGFGWLLDENGTLLYHPEHPEMIDRSIFATDTKCLQCHKTGFFLERDIVGKYREGHTRYVAAMDKYKLIAYSPIYISNRNWTIFVSAPYSEVIRLNRQNFLYITLFLLVIVGSSLIINLFIFDINKKRIQAENKALYTDRLEREVVARTLEIEQERHKLDDVVRAVGARLCVIDPEFRILWANQKVTERFGDLNKIGSANCYRTFYGRDSVCPDCPAIKTFAQGEIAQMECTTDNQRRYYQITSTPISDPDGKVVQILELTQDITTQKLQEQSLINSKKLMAVGQLAVGLAHDLGNPLTIVAGSAQFCLKNLQVPENVREHLEVINRNVSAASKVIKALLQFARPSVKKEFAPLSLPELADKSLLLLSAELAKKNIQVERNFPAGTHDIMGDRSQLEQVVVNIVLNAIEAISAGGGKIWIDLQENPKERTVSLVFTDSGCGVPEEVLDMVFEPFFTTRVKGVGLGLSISKQIIEHHRGQILVCNSPGRGAQFTLQFPWYEVTPSEGEEAHVG